MSPRAPQPFLWTIFQPHVSMLQTHSQDKSTLTSTQMPPLTTSWIKTNLELPLPITPQKLFTVTNDFLTVSAKDMFQSLP